MRKPIAWMKELVPQKGLEWQVVLTAHEEMAKDWEQPVIPLYTKQEWVGLTDEEIDLLEYLYAPPVHPDFVNDADHCFSLIKKVEAKLKERNT